MSGQSTLWQLLPDLSEEQYEGLKASIAERGVLVPVEYDEEGNILDGHHRVRACEELGITEWPRIVRGGLSDDQKAEHVLEVNLARRHLTREQRRELVRGLRERGWSLRRIGAWLGVDAATVMRDSGVADATPGAVTGSDGKTYPARQPERTPSVFATNQREQREAQRLVRQCPSPPAPLPEGEGSRAQVAAVATVRDARRAVSDQRRQEARERAAEAGRDAAMSPEAQVLSGDFRVGVSGIADESVSLVFTDPPYDRESIPLYGELAEDAARVLKPGGSLIAYVGNYAIPEVLDAMRPHLTFWWLLGIGYQGSTRRFPGRFVFVDLKPLVWFVKGPRRATETMLTDLFRSDDQAEKDLHDWGQRLCEATYYVNALTEPGETVLDPFCGSGTTVLAAAQAGRRGIGIELDPERANVARGRIAAALSGVA